MWNKINSIQINSTEEKWDGVRFRKEPNGTQQNNYFQRKGKYLY